MYVDRSSSVHKRLEHEIFTHLYRAPRLRDSCLISHGDGMLIHHITGSLCTFTSIIFYKLKDLVGLGRHNLKFPHHIQWDFSRWGIGLSHNPLPNNKQHSQQTSMPPAEFELAILAMERPQTRALDRSATRMGPRKYRDVILHTCCSWSQDRSPVALLRIFSGSFDSSMCPGVDSASKNE
jgi:hypothetical protein